MSSRVGIGFDVHAFQPGRPLVLGGVAIPSTNGLAGHSDADVAVHALIDAVLGCLGWGDIGRWFPDNSEKFKNADSLELLEEVWAAVEQKRWRLGNCDLTVLAQAPKIAPHIDTMRTRLAEAMNCPLSSVSVKATTTERLGFVGREEGIAVMAVAMLEGEADASLEMPEGR